MIPTKIKKVSRSDIDEINVRRLPPETRLRCKYCRRQERQKFLQLRHESPEQFGWSDGSSPPASPSRQLPQCPAIILHHFFDGPFDFLFRGPFADWHQHDCAAVVDDGDVKLIAHFHSGQIHQSRVKNNSLRIANLADGLGHAVILCFTRRPGKPKPMRSSLPMAGLEPARAV